MKELEINQDKCLADKRRLVFDCELRGKRYQFVIDGWAGEDISELLIDGVSSPYNIISFYKWNVQVALTTEVGYIFIDRRYEHEENEYDVYFEGKHYLVKETK